VEAGRLKWRISLVEVEASVNETGDPITTKIARTVKAERKSVSQKEFYQAQATGLKPEITFVIRSANYRGEMLLIYEQREYSIIRTYENEKERSTELVCTSLIGGR